MKLSKWKKIQGKKLFKIVSGYAPSKIILSNDEKAKGRFVKVSDMNHPKNRKYIVTSENKFLLESNPNIDILPKNTLIIAKRGVAIFQNRVRILGDNSTIDTNLMGLILNERANLDFFYHQLIYKKLFRIVENAGIPQLNNKQIYPYKFDVPPLVEQRGIVEVLGCVDKCIRLTDEVIAAAEELKRGLMQRLLTQGIGHTEYKQTKLGQIPQGWKVIRVKQITRDHKQGYYTKEKYVEEGVKLVRVTDLLNPKISWETMPKLKIDNKTYEQFKVEKGDFLFARSGAIGRYGIVNGNQKGIFGSYIIRFKLNNRMVDNDYFGYVYQSHKIQNQIHSYKHGSTNININAEDIKSLSIALPELQEQKEIVKIISNVDRKIIQETYKKAYLRQVKQGLMQSLLSGKVRVELREDGLHRVADNRETHN